VLRIFVSEKEKLKMEFMGGSEENFFDGFLRVNLIKFKIKKIIVKYYFKNKQPLNLNPKTFPFSNPPNSTSH
jgi:hypothetical protein